jgi:hypothetical protein
MDNLSDLGKCLRYELLKKDVELIVSSFDAFDVSEIHPRIVKDQYQDSRELYDDMVSILTVMHRCNDLIDMMPFIDDYIETYFNQ